MEFYKEDVSVLRASVNEEIDYGEEIDECNDPCSWTTYKFDFVYDNYIKNKIQMKDVINYLNYQKCLPIDDIVGSDFINHFASLVFSDDIGVFEDSLKIISILSTFESYQLISEIIKCDVINNIDIVSNMCNSTYSISSFLDLITRVTEFKIGFADRFENLYISSLSSQDDRLVFHACECGYDIICMNPMSDLSKAIFYSFPRGRLESMIARHFIGSLLVFCEQGICDFYNPQDLLIYLSTPFEKEAIKCIVSATKLSYDASYSTLNSSIDFDSLLLSNNSEGASYILCNISIWSSDFARTMFQYFPSLIIVANTSTIHKRIEAMKAIVQIILSSGEESSIIDQHLLIQGLEYGDNMLKLMIIELCLRLKHLDHDLVDVLYSMNDSCIESNEVKNSITLLIRFINQKQ